MQVKGCLPRSRYRVGVLYVSHLQEMHLRWLKFLVSVTAQGQCSVSAFCVIIKPLKKELLLNCLLSKEMKSHFFFNFSVVIQDIKINDIWASSPKMSLVLGTFNTLMSLRISIFLFPPRWSNFLYAWAAELTGGALCREGEAAVRSQAHSHAEAASIGRPL